MNRRCLAKILFITAAQLFSLSSLADNKAAKKPKAISPARQDQLNALSLKAGNEIGLVCEQSLTSSPPAAVSKRKLPAGSTVVLDTNVLMKYPQAIHNYPGLRVVIPKQVIRELDNNNHRDNIAAATKANIRAVLRELKSLAKAQGPWSGPVQEIDLKDGAGTVIVFDHRDHLAELKKITNSKVAEAAVASLDPNHPDDQIIAAAAFYYTNKGSVFSGDVALVTGDGVATMSALEVGLNALEHSVENHYAQEELDGKIYNGRLFIDLSAKQYESLNGKQFIAKEQLLKLTGQNQLRLYPNQFVVFMKPGDRAIYQGYLRGENDGLPNNQMIGCYNAQNNSFEIVPSYGSDELAIDLNLEQRMAFYAAINPRIRRLIMTGKAGTGKTVISLLAARMQLSSMPAATTRDRFEAIVMTKTDNPVGDRDPGALPGTIEEKLGPVYASYKDALSFVIGREKRLAFKNKLEDGASLKGQNHQVAAERTAEDFVRSEQVEIAHFGFFRGRTFRHRLVIFDEAQNLSPHEMKTLVTRIGEKAKLIVMGDVNQIDAGYNDRNNGLSDLIHLTTNKWGRELDTGAWSPGSDQSAVVQLVRSRREVLVEWTTQLYDEQE